MEKIICGMCKKFKWGGTERCTIEENKNYESEPCSKFNLSFLFEPLEQDKTCYTCFFHRNFYTEQNDYSEFCFLDGIETIENYGCFKWKIKDTNK